MPRKYFFLILAVLFIVIIATVSLWIIYRTTPDQTGNKIPIVGSLFPSSASRTTDTSSNPTPSTSSTSNTFPTPQVQQTNIEKINNNPISGFGLLEGSGSSSEKIIFLEKISNDIFIAEENSKSLEKKYSLGSKEAYLSSFSQDKDNYLGLVIFPDNQYLLRIPKNYRLPSSTPSFSSNNPYFSTINRTILSSSLSFGEPAFFYLSQSNNRTFGYLNNFKKDTASFTNLPPLKELRTIFVDKTKAVIETRPSSFFPGFLYNLDLQSKKLSKILGNIVGLSAKVSPNGQQIAYSAILNGLPQLLIYDTDKKISTNTKLKTLAEKCAWSKDSKMLYCYVPRSLPAGDYPDDWYKGKLILEDYLSVFDVSSNRNATLDQLPGTKIDVEEAVINKSQSVIYLKDRDNNLYRHRLGL